MTDKSKLNRKKTIRYLSAALVIAALTVFGILAKAYFDGHFNSVESLRVYIERFGAWGPLVLTVFQAIQVILPVLPGFLGCAVGTVLFGPFVGFLCNYIGIGAGSVIAFFLARKYGMPLVQELFPAEKYKKWAKWAAESKAYTVCLFLVILLPAFPDDFFCYFTGVTEMKVRKYLWIIILGKPWYILAYCFGVTLIL